MGYSVNYQTANYSGDGRARKFVYLHDLWRGYLDFIQGDVMRIIIDMTGRYCSTVTELIDSESLIDGFSVVEIPDDTIGLHDGCIYANEVITGCIVDRENVHSIASEIEIFATTSSLARVKRSQLLTDSDWTQLPDVPETTQSKWLPYRQALRDITNQSGFPQSVNWPEQPKKDE